MHLPELDNIRAIRASLAAITLLPTDDMHFLEERVNRLERMLEDVDFTLSPTMIQGDPQHRNALRDGGRTVLCDWDTIAWGSPDWDLVTIEIHCRRFGHGLKHYRSFADSYELDITNTPGYDVLRDVRELRMITTNARKARHTPGTLDEVRARIEGFRREDAGLRWHIL